MKKELNILYRFIESSTEQASYYKVIQLFSEFGPVNPKTVRMVYRDFENSTAEAEDPLHFTSLESLGHFSIEILKETGSPEAFLLSTGDYNIGLDSCLDSDQFRDLFRRYGTGIENPDSNIKKKSLFGNLFTKP